MKTDIEIAQEAELLPIREVAARLDISEDELELYGTYKAKLTDELLQKHADKPDGKLVLVTAINPTPAGEGKTTTSIGLGQAFGLMGKKAVLALREPSLGPCFGIKGGAFMRLRRQIIFWRLCWTIIYSRETHLGSIRDRSSGNAVWI